ncbi:MAG: hypothetical protein ACNA7G_07340 [Methylobacter sp.]
MDEAARWRILDRTVQVIKDRNQAVSDEMMEAMIEEAIRDVRTEIHHQTSLNAVLDASCGLPSSDISLDDAEKITPAAPVGVQS